MKKSSKAKLPILNPGVKPKFDGADCERCPLFDAPFLPDVPAPSGHVKIAVVFDAPEAYAVKNRSLLTEGDRRLFEQSFRAVGKENIYYTSAIKCAITDKTKKEIGAARSACAPGLDRTLDRIKAKVVAAPGSIAAHSAGHMRRKGRVMDWRGSIIPVSFSGAEVQTATTHVPIRYRWRRLVVPMLYPATVKYNSLMRPVWDVDAARISRIAARGWQPPEASEGHTRLPTPANVTELKHALSRFGRTVAVDVETLGVDALTVPLLCIGISDGTFSVTIAWSCTPQGEGRYFGKMQERAAQIIRRFFQTHQCVTHNGPMFDHIVLKEHGMPIEPDEDDGHTWDDTLLAYHAVAAHLPRGLSHVVSMYLAAVAWKEDYGAKATRKGSAVTLDAVMDYNVRDVLYTARVWRSMQENIAPVRQVYEQDKRSAVLCRRMQVAGFAFDMKASNEARHKLVAEEARILRQIYEIAGDKIDPNKPAHLRAILLEKLGAPVLDVSPLTGKPKLDVNVMRAYTAGADERIANFASAVLEYRRVAKMRGTYIDGVKLGADGRVHPTWLSYGAISGRFSCQRPSLMNLIKGDVAGSSVRSLYIAEPGNVLVSFDFSQLEMRVAAYVSGDKVMIEACEHSDLHAANAKILFPEFSRLEPKSNEWKQLRNIAKTAGFAVCYGAGAETIHARIIAQGTPITMQQVEAMLRRLKQAFSAYYAWQLRNLVKTTSRGYVESPIVRRRRYLGYSPSPTENANYPIQSGAADLMNTTLWEISEQMPSNVRLVAQIHDQAIFEVPASEADGMVELCRQVAESPRKINDHTVVFKTDPTSGRRWSDL